MFCLFLDSFALTRTATGCSVLHGEPRGETLILSWVKQSNKDTEKHSNTFISASLEKNGKENETSYLEKPCGAMPPHKLSLSERISPNAEVMHC